MEKAVYVEGATKSYGKLRVLDGLNMNVDSGSIYSLLGASGCGKTTLLRCILGQLVLNEGRIKVFGKSQGSANLDIPGKGVGYMPQDLALFENFTTSESFYYYGILYHMKFKDIQSRKEILEQLLELPTKIQLVGTLSGGQKRRISLAIAMLHGPPLMILDEPTVGVDPLLRSKIWEYLVDLVNTGKTTVILTTHYIEEASHANTVGIMRGGKLLAEEPPAELTDFYQKDTLEGVFLQLSHLQDSRDSETSEATPRHKRSKKTAGNKEELLLDQKSQDVKEDRWKFPKKITSSLKNVMTPKNFIPKPVNIAALFWKEMINLYRNPRVFVFTIIQPIIIFIITVIAIGTHIDGLKVVYTSDDFLQDASSLSFLCNNTDIDVYLNGYGNLGQLFLDELTYNTSLSTEKFNSYDKAVDQVNQGKAWAVIYIGSNFTVDLFQRICSVNTCPPYVDGAVNDEIINGSTIFMRYDFSDSQISETIENETAKAYQQFYNQLIELCSAFSNITTSVVLPPVVKEAPPIYGKPDLYFLDNLAPGMAISVIFRTSMAFTAVMLIVERKKGLVERATVAGVNFSEVITAILILQFLILMIQIPCVIIIDIIKKLFTADKSLYWLFGAIAMLQGLVGTSEGLLLSALVNSEIAAVQATSTAFSLPFYLSGVLWPLEGMPKWLRYIAYALPSTLGIQSAKYALTKGWSLDHKGVLSGVFVSLAYIIGFLLLTLFISNCRK